MSDKAFLDTNVFVYDIDEDAPSAKRKVARDLIRGSLGARAGVISFQVVNELVNVALRKVAKQPGKLDLREYVRLIMFSQIVVQSSPGLTTAALERAERYRISWYDALIVSAAEEAGCSILYTEDLQDGLKIGRLKIVNPFRVH